MISLNVLPQPAIDTAALLEWVEKAKPPSARVIPMPDQDEEKTAWNRGSQCGIIRGGISDCESPVPPLSGKPNGRLTVFLEVYPQVLGVSTHKVCSKCGEFKPLDDFHRDKGSKSGRTSDCRECACLRAREWADANRNRKQEADRIYRENNREHRQAVKQLHYRNNKKRHQEQGAIWYRANRDRVLERTRRYAAEHQEDRLEYARQYRLTEQGKALETANRQKRRARKHSAHGMHSKNDLIAIRVAQTDKQGRLRCWWCGKPIKGTPHLDHKIALAVGGSNDAGNLCYSCAPCNQSKSVKSPAEFAGRLF